MVNSLSVEDRYYLKDIIDGRYSGCLNAFLYEEFEILMVTRHKYLASKVKLCFIIKPKKK